MPKTGEKDIDRFNRLRTKYARARAEADEMSRKLREPYEVAMGRQHAAVRAIDGDNGPLGQFKKFYGMKKSTSKGPKNQRSRKART